jgi:hypothetical protein
MRNNPRSLLRIGAALWLIVASALMLPNAHAEDTGSMLDQILAGAHRDPKNTARDQYRHPKETLLFFGLRPDMTVVEVWVDGDPGPGTEGPGPVLRGLVPNSSQRRSRLLEAEGEGVRR